MESEVFTGYGCKVNWDGDTLRAKGTNKLTHRALMGQNRQFSQEDAEGIEAREVVSKVLEIPDELVVKRQDFEVEKFKPASALVNGVLALRTTDGIKYQLHFRRKDNEDFTRLRDLLG